MEIKLGNSYHIYGKISNMKRYRPLSKDRFVTNLIHADIFKIDTEKDKEELEREMKFLNKQGSFSLRRI